MIFVNFKTYMEAAGENAVKLALTCEVVSEETGISIIPVVQAIDLWRITQHVHIPVWIQHVDPFEPGTHSGFVTIKSAVSAGANGTLLNHSEHPIEKTQLEKTIQHIQEINTDFSTLVCAPDIEMVQRIKHLNPTFVAYEPPDLIGSKNSSVASEQADVIAKGVEAANPIPLIVGAGIKSKEDVVVSLQKGAKGILVASAVVLSQKPEEKLRELASGFSVS